MQDNNIQSANDDIATANAPSEYNNTTPHSPHSPPPITQNSTLHTPHSATPLYHTPYPTFIPKTKPENAFKPDMLDLAFALLVFVLGYLFSRMVIFTWMGWGVTAFTTVYLAATSWYLIKKGAFRSNLEAWFWFTITLLTGISYSLWNNAGFAGYRSLFLFCSAVYYVIIATDSTLIGKSSNYLLIDGLNAYVILPFRNFINQYVSFSALGKSGKRGKILPTLLGIAIVMILLAILIPLLRSADSGGFAVVVDFFAYALRYINFDVFVYFFLGIPVAAYIYGLVSAVVFKKGTDIIKPEAAKKTAAALRKIHTTTVFIVFVLVCLLYIIFILSQLPYFFSAFTGNRPAGWLIYSEYARQGFFELCTIAIINLCILTSANMTCKKQRADSQVLKVFNILLAVITLILIATAFSKMALYIDAYGMTMRRLLPCVTMVFLAAIFLALIALQKWTFSIVRFAIVTGSIILCLMSFANLDAVVCRYNTNRYLSGTLKEYDTTVLFRAGSAGVLPALEVYNIESDGNTLEYIKWYLEFQHTLIKDQTNSSSFFGRGINTYSFESYRAISRLSAFQSEYIPMCALHFFESEGIKFFPDGRMAMDTCLWIE